MRWSGLHGVGLLPRRLRMYRDGVLLLPGAADGARVAVLFGARESLTSTTKNITPYLFSLFPYHRVRPYTYRPQVVVAFFSVYPFSDATSEVFS